MFLLKAKLLGMPVRAALAGVIALAFCFAAGPMMGETPDETFKALGLAKTASPRELYDALRKRYNDPGEGAGKGSFSKYWEPIPISKYLNPRDFYTPTQSVDADATRAQCVECHARTTPGWVHSWQKSVHGNLDEIRKLPETDSRAYKKSLLAEVEGNMRSMGLLKAGETLKEVGCIDCHMGVNKDHGQHKTDLKMPDATACGQCHVKQFAERESERDTYTWPQAQWPKGGPSHALSYQANVENAVWAAMEQREVAEGCTFCHTSQNTCNSCHTRHEFSVAEARKPQACAMCHNGVDHNEFENYLLSKHGTVFQTRGDKWDWNAPLANAMEKGGMNAPTCQICHMEYQGQFSHNMVRKTRWAFEPTPKIAENLHHPWFEGRKEAWVGSCSNCHSDSFGRAYLDSMDKGVISGVKITEESRSVVVKLYNDGLLPGQKTNRPAPPATEKTDEPGASFQLFWQKGNNPSAVEYEFAEMWEHHKTQHYKALAHMNPGGYTYSGGWSQLIKSAARINDEDARLRETAEIRAELKRIATQKRGGLLELDTPFRQAAAAGVGGLALLAGVGMMLRSRRKDQ
jgi:hydroxylamine dehydrogenase